MIFFIQRPRPRKTGAVYVTAGLPRFTLGITILTLVVSSIVAYLASGDIFGKAPSRYLYENDGLSLEQLRDGEIWRLFSSQLIHVHALHMLYNTLSLLLLGCVIESKIGAKVTFLIWFFAGASGTLLSSVLATPPWPAGTGASQAFMGFAGFTVLFFYRRSQFTYALGAILTITLIPAVYLDIKAVSFPKPGHCLSFIVGALMALAYERREHMRGRPVQQNKTLDDG